MAVSIRGKQIRTLKMEVIYRVLGTESSIRKNSKKRAHSPLEGFLGGSFGKPERAHALGGVAVG